MSDDKVMDRIERLARENGRLQADIRAIQTEVAALKAARPAKQDLIAARDEYQQNLAKATATLDLVAAAADFEVTISRYTDGKWTACIGDGPVSWGYDLQAVLQEILEAEGEE